MKLDHDRLVEFCSAYDPDDTEPNTRYWQSLAGPLTVGDVHINPRELGSALFSELVVHTYFGDPAIAVVANTWDGTKTDEDLLALQFDNDFILPAIWAAIQSQGNL